MGVCPQCDPYPTAQQANEWSSSFEPENDLGDLHMTDYLAAASRISRRHVRQMVMHPYQHGLLMRGLQRYSVDERGAICLAPLMIASISGPHWGQTPMKPGFTL